MKEQLKKEIVRDMYDKKTVLDYLWLHSRFNAICLHQSEVLYREGKGFAAVTVLFSCLESVAKSVTNDFESTLKKVFKKLWVNEILTETEYNFLNVGSNCIREIRNLYAHANISAIYLIDVEEGKEILCPFTEDETSSLLYKKVSDIVYNLILKCISADFIDEVKQRFSQPLDNAILQCELRIKVLSVRDLLVLKGYPSEYISDDIEMSEAAKYRLVDNAPDLNMRMHILSQMKNAGLFEALKNDSDGDRKN